MPIKRYVANADNTITNAYKTNLSTRGTGSNMGQSDILEVFSIYGQVTTSSAEMSRVLINFPVSTISSDRSAGTIPASGSVSFFLKLYNAEHPFTLPRDYKLSVHAASAVWEEGNGLDMDNYTDITRDRIGSNWIKRSGSTSWSTEGGDFYTDSSSSYTKAFTDGDEDLELNVTTIVEQWVNSGGNVLGSMDSNGLLIKLTSSYEPSSSSNLAGAVKSYYTKKFFGRGTEFFFKRPIIEARWESNLKDDRGNFYLSSSLATGKDNLNTIYLYNHIKGNLKNIPSIGTDTIRVSIFSGSANDSQPLGDALTLVAGDSNANVSNLNQLAITGSYVSTGIYKATFALTGTSALETVYDVWWSGSAAITNAADGAIQFHTGTIKTSTFEASNINPNGNYVVSMPNLKSSYSNTETERFRLYVRDKNWSPTIYVKASQKTPATLIIESASYQVTRVSDQKVVVPYGTGSDDSNYSLLSYDVSGNYFDLDLSMLEPGYTYGLQYSFYEDSVSSYREQPHMFKFRVEKDEY